MKIKAVCGNLSLQHGKVLRYIVSRSSDPTAPSQVVNKIAWSDLPHSLLEAKKCFNDLAELKLIEKRGAKFVSTDSGAKVVAYANTQGLWSEPPPPEIVNSLRRNN